jgi:hypothetical protein
MQHMKFIGSWAIDPCEDIDLESALRDLRVIIMRPEEFDEDMYDNAVDTLRARFGLEREAIGDML